MKTLLKNYLPALVLIIAVTDICKSIDNFLSSAL